VAQGAARVLGASEGALLVEIALDRVAERATPGP
jgi:hypothetical protein